MLPLKHYYPHHRTRIKSFVGSTASSQLLIFANILILLLAAISCSISFGACHNPDGRHDLTTTVIPTPASSSVAPTSCGPNVTKSTKTSSSSSSSIPVSSRFILMNRREQSANMSTSIHIHSRSSIDDTSSNGHQQQTTTNNDSSSSTASNDNNNNTNSVASLDNNYSTEVLSSSEEKESLLEHRVMGVADSMNTVFDASQRLLLQLQQMQAGLSFFALSCFFLFRSVVN